MFNKELVKKTKTKRNIKVHIVFDRLKQNVEFSSLVAELIKIEQSKNSKYNQNHFIRRVIYDTSVS